MKSNTFTDRMEWSLDIQERHALEIYHRHWDVDRIIEVDKLGQTDDDMQVLDFSGTDKIVITDDGYPIHIAQRFRQPYYDDETGWTDADFSLRLQSYNSDHVEYQKLLDAYTGHGTIPSVYAFGRTVQGRQPALEHGFKEFYLIDLPVFIRKHLADDIPPIEKAPNGDGSMAYYFNLDCLSTADCIIEKYGGGTP